MLNQQKCSLSCALVVIHVKEKILCNFNGFLWNHHFPQHYYWSPISCHCWGPQVCSELGFYSLNVNCIYACASCGMLHRIICINTHVCVCVYIDTHIRGAIERSLKVFKLISTELVTSLSSARAQTCKLELSSR